MSKMKAVAMLGRQKVEMVEVDRPRISDDEVLTKTLYTSISPGSYLQRFTGVDTRLVEGRIAYPFITGYLNVGEIVEVGKSVKNYAVGDRLNVLCFVRGTNLAMHNGSDAEYQAVNMNFKGIKLSGDPRHSAFSIVGTTGLSAAMEAVSLSGRSLVDMSVAVLGQGLVGLGCTRAFGLFGCGPIVATDLMDRRLELAKKFGACDVRDMRKESVADLLRDYPDGFDFVVETTGNSAVLADALKLARKDVILVSLYTKPVTLDLGENFHQKRKYISANKAFANSNPLSYHMVDRGCFDIEPAISDVIRPEDSQWAYEALLNEPQRHLGILVDWTGQTRERRRVWND